MKMIHAQAPIVLLTLALATGGCDSNSSDTKKDIAASADESGDDSTKPASKPASEKDSPPPKMVEHDLGTAHEVWKGWVAEGPEGAKVLADGVKGARIAGKGRSMLDHEPGGDNGFDVAWEPGKRDLSELKENLEKGAENSVGDVEMTLDFIAENDDMLEWTSEVNETKAYNFVKHIQVDGEDYTCKNNYMIGSGNEAEHERAKAACDTLRKK